MAIIVLGAQQDDHAVHVLEYLLGRGADAVLLDSRWFPSTLAITFAPRLQSGCLVLPCGRTLAFDEVQSVYWRTYEGISPPELTNPEQSYIALNDARALFESMLIRLQARWVNSWHAFQLHQTKPVQLAMVAGLNIPVPETLFTNDPAALTRFVGEHPNAIFKPVQGGAHTRRIGTRHLTPENLANLRFAPVTIQEFVPGTNIRVFVAETRVLACEIETAALDFREDDAPVIRPVTLPEIVENQCRRIAAHLDLVWTGIDLRQTPSGNYIFLEANPSPMFMGFELHSGLPLTEALAELLLT